jgi:hypothetical protein
VDDFADGLWCVGGDFAVDGGGTKVVGAVKRP